MRRLHQQYFSPGPSVVGILRTSLPYIRNNGGAGTPNSAGDDQLCFKAIPASFISLLNQISPPVAGDASLIPAHEHQQRRECVQQGRLKVVI